MSQANEKWSPKAQLIRVCSRGFAIKAILAIFVISSSIVNQWRHASSLGRASTWRWKRHEPRLYAPRPSGVYFNRSGNAGAMAAWMAVLP